MPSKLLFTGAANGKLTDLFEKIAKLNKAHHFAFVIVTGNLFADAESTTKSEKHDFNKLLEGGFDVPATTYFTIGDRPLPPAVVQKLEANDGELCPNLFVLGRKSSIKTSDGFRIVAVGGKYTTGTDEIADQYDAAYNDMDAQTVAKDVEQADVLITSDWPQDIQIGSKKLYEGTSPPGSQAVADLCTRLKPRYHFSPSAAWFEREPFFQPGDSPRHLTRFVSLAPLGSPAGQKAFVAYSLEPSALPPAQVPQGCTASPLFQPSRKRKLETQQDSFNSFRYSNGNSAGYNDHGGKRRRGPRGDSYMPPRPEDCFFCLSNRKAETHMITSIAENSYMTVAKGPLPTATTFPELGIPCHMLIIPVPHSPTIASIPDQNEREATLQEMEKYRANLQQLVATKSRKSEGESPTLGAVTYTISKASGVHIQWQFIPIHADKIDSGVVQAGFEVEAENFNYPKFAKSTGDVRAAEQGDHFKVWLWTESTQREMVLPLDGGIRFDLQFGRRVLAKLLGLDKRYHWRDCTQSTEEEKVDAEKFKVAFKPWDD